VAIDTDGKRVSRPSHDSLDEQLRRLLRRWSRASCRVSGSAAGCRRSVSRALLLLEGGTQRCPLLAARSLNQAKRSRARQAGGLEPSRERDPVGLGRLRHGARRAEKACSRRLVRLFVSLMFRSTAAHTTPAGSTASAGKHAPPPGPSGSHHRKPTPLSCTSDCGGVDTSPRIHAPASITSG
jgi:hypothetical protein